MGDVVNALEWRPDGEVVATADAGGSVKLWNPASASVVTEVRWQQTALTALSWSPRGEVLAAGGRDGKIRLLRNASLADTTELSSSDSEVRSLSWNADGTAIAAGYADNRVRLWDARGALQKEILPQAGGGSLVHFSPGGEMLAAAGYNKDVSVLSADGGRLLRKLEGGHEISPDILSWSPDGRWLLSASSGLSLSASLHREARLNVWNSRNGEIYRTIRQVEGNLESSAWSVDSRLLALGHSSGRVEIWNVENNLQLYTFPLHNGGVTQLAWSPDEKVLASVGRDKRLSFVTLDVDLWLEHARRIVNRELGHEEWQEYLGNEPYAPSFLNEAGR